VELILTNLQNPRGVVVFESGDLLVAEAGTGLRSVDPTLWTGKLTRFSDLNGDGDFDDEAEAQSWFSHLPSYNALSAYATGGDEVGGPVDVLQHSDGRVFLSVDGGPGEIALQVISPERTVGRTLADRANMNGIAFDRDQSRLYAVESGTNTLIEISYQSEIREIVSFLPLNSGQQAVPAGLAVNPRTGDVLVALFSGRVVGDETGETIPFVRGESKIVRVNPETGRVTDEITGLTTAVDVAIDLSGNLYVVELASAYADNLPRAYDLFDESASPLHGGYLRYSGRLTLFPPSGAPPRVLVKGLDAPTNVTLGPEGALYLSTGQGTPGRSIPGPNGPRKIVGEIFRITNYLSEGSE
jgi:DNA-binding beta-propeller fold protein YncE